MHFETEHGKKNQNILAHIIAFCGQMLPKSEQFRIMYTIIQEETT